MISSLELLGIQIDDMLNFNLHISSIWKSAANQLNALIRLKQLLSFHAKEVLINSYMISSFNQFPLVWIFWSAQSGNEMKNMQKKFLHFLNDNFESFYEDLPSKRRKSTMNVRGLGTLLVKIYKTLRIWTQVL